MSKQFLFFASEAPEAGTPDRAIDATLPQREALRILVIGSRQGVTSTIQTLHRLRFAEVREWSPLMPAAGPGEVMSILTRYLLRG